MQIVDCWKVSRSEDREDTIQDLVDILAAELIEDTYELKEVNEEDSLPRRISLATTTTIPSSLSTEKSHTMERVTSQLRCLWFSRVNLLHRKNFLK